MKTRIFEVQDSTASKYFKRLEEFLGSAHIDQRLSKIDLELRTETGLYLQNWVFPKLAWWLGFRAARDLIHRGVTLRRAITPLMMHSLQTAVKLSYLHSSTPEWKRGEFQSRILGDNILDPVLFEIDCAAHFFMSGYDIRWFEIPIEKGIRTPEFVAKNGDYEIEVECKTKKADSGRRIERALFYRVADHLIPVIQEKGLCGEVFLTLPARLPSTASWRTEAAKALGEQIKRGVTIVTLPEGEQFRCELKPMEGLEILIQDLQKKISENSTPYSHHAIFGNRKNNNIIDPVIFRLESVKKDAFLEDVLDSLRDAEGQFTGKRAAIISCMVPEIDSFEGLQADSAIQVMTTVFFEKYARSCINAVSYVSNAQREIQGPIILSDMPSLSFQSHKYDQKFGPQPPIYGE
jgi:hypothetical protein